MHHNAGTEGKRGSGRGEELENVGETELQRGEEVETRELEKRRRNKLRG